MASLKSHSWTGTPPTLCTGADAWHFLLFSHFLSDCRQISHALVSAAPGGGLLEFLLSPVVLSGDMQISPGLVASPRPRVLSQVGGLQNPLPGSPQPPERPGSSLSGQETLSLRRPRRHPSVPAPPVYQSPSRTPWCPGLSACTGNNSQVFMTPDQVQNWENME